jgi:DNA-binding NarL/FixJ family response regulator
MTSWTPRQTQIADLAALGLTNGEIASALKVTPAAVLAELEALYRDLGGSGPSSARLPSDPASRAVRPEGANL